jgi:hypothetical protein
MTASRRTQKEDTNAKAQRGMPVVGGTTVVTVTVGVGSVIVG